MKKRYQKTTVCGKTLDNTSDVVPKLQVEEPTSFWTNCGTEPNARRAKTSARWTSFCMHLGLVPSQNKHAKMSPREIGGCRLRNRPRNMCQKVTVLRKLPWWNLRRGAKLRGRKTYRRDGNHATRKAEALLPPWDEVTS